jgi:hypothetical protein
MKHVIVYGCRGSAEEFLDRQQLLESPHRAADGRGDPYDSCSYLDRIGSRNPTPLDSQTGIRFYHFKDKFFATNPGHFTGTEHFEYWLECVEHKIALRNRFVRDKEQLDALVIPEGVKETPQFHTALARFKQAHPATKIIAIRPQVQEAGTPIDGHFAVHATNAHATTNRAQAPVLHTSAETIIAPYLVAAMVDLPDRIAGQWLCSLIGADKAPPSAKVWR